MCGPWLGELKSRRSGSIRRSRGAVAERISRDAKRSPRLELGGECGASKPKPLHGHFVESATLRPERRGCGRQGGRPHRSRQAGWSPTTRESESAASAMGAQQHRGRRSLARAQSLHGESRRRALQALPLEWGAEPAAFSAWGKSFPQTKGGLKFWIFFKQGLHVPLSVKHAKHLHAIRHRPVKNQVVFKPGNGEESHIPQARIFELSHHAHSWRCSQCFKCPKRCFDDALRRVGIVQGDELPDGPKVFLTSRGQNEFSHRFSPVGVRPSFS